MTMPRKLPGFSGFVMLLLLLASLIGCASMDTRVDTFPGTAYRKYTPRIQFEQMKIYENGRPDRPFVVIAKYIAQETPTVLTGVPAGAMIRHVAETAHKDGADAVIVEQVDVVNVPGYARHSPKVTVVGIRFTD